MATRISTPARFTSIFDAADEIAASGYLRWTAQDRSDCPPYCCYWGSLARTASRSFTATVDVVLNGACDYIPTVVIAQGTGNTRRAAIEAAIEAASAYPLAAAV